MDSDSDSDGYSATDSSSAPIAEAHASILMLSLPDSLDDEADNKTSADHDVFETPPEYALAGTSQDKTPLLNLTPTEPGADDQDSDGDIRDGSRVIVAVGGCGEDGDGDVDEDLERDAVSETESVEEFRVSKRREVSSVEPSPQSKKSRVLEEGELEKSDEELETEQLNLSNQGAGSDQTLEIAEDVDVKSVSAGTKEPEISGPESENGSSEETPKPFSEESSGQSGLEYSFQEEDGEIDSGEVLRVMPLSFCPPAEPNSMDGKTDEWSSLLETVKLVKDLTCKEDNVDEKCSLLEIAKRRGMTFPRASAVE